MENPSAILKQGVEVWNKWRKEKNPDYRIRLEFADIVGVDLRRIDFHGVDLSGVHLGRADFREADLSGADLRGAYLSEAHLDKARLDEAHLGGANLNGAYLVGAFLDSANLHAAHLIKADLHGAHLWNAKLSAAHLTRACLDGAYLDSTYLFEAGLSEASLSGAYLVGANFTGAYFKEANFSGAQFGQTLLAHTNLSQTKGLEECVHLFKSYVSMDTLQRSMGKIPTTFLRGCGLSDIEIEFAKLANPGLDPEQVTDITYKIHQLYLGGGIQYYSCFISYNSRDETFARQLHDDLQNNGVRCWFAPEDMKIGDQIRPAIDKQIRLRDRFLVILSENSVKSEWVGDEVEGALEEESKSNRLVLFPIRLDDTVMSTRDDWAAKIKRRRHIGDFSNWKDKASYQKAFECLLRDLKAMGGEVHGE